MDRAEYESLTPMERNCLRLAHHERKTEQIAHELGIAASTVNTHIFAARRKLGGLSRLSAADRLRRFEADAGDCATEEPDMRGTPTTSPLGAPPQPLSRPPLSMGELPADGADLPPPTEVREERATFVFDAVVPIPGGQDRRPDAPYQRVIMILAMAVLAALVLIAAPAIYDSAAQRVANSLERPHAR